MMAKVKDAQRASPNAIIIVVHIRHFSTFISCILFIVSNWFSVGVASLLHTIRYFCPLTVLVLSCFHSN